jgi:membrane peptidoglycan carboxypeptidase
MAVARLVALPLMIAGAAVLFGASISPAATVAAGIVRTVDRDMLDYPPVPGDLQELAERSVILDGAGNRLAIVRDENRLVVELDEVPELVRQAVVATEDRDFYEHGGVNWRSVVRAAVGNLQAGEITSGASTITQQLVKQVVLDDDSQTLDRKMQEAVYAIQLEKQMSKDAILEHYLNTAYFGNGVYGIGTAADYYWGKQVSQLTLGEGALLAGMLRAPERNNPVDRPDNAIARRRIVLSQMVDGGYIGDGEAQRLADLPLDLRVRQRSDDSRDFVVSYVLEELKANPALGPDPDRRFQYLSTGGLTIRTTINPQLQQVARRAILEHLEPGDDALAALTAVDPRSGAILAIGFGPREFGTGPGQVDVNPAVPGLGSPGRQSGSAFKAFEVVTALEDGVSPAYTIDTPSPYEEERFCVGPSPWRPGNYSDSGGGVMDMARATAASSNVYFSHLVDEHTGPERLKETAERMGIAKNLGGNCAAVLGTDNVHVLDMASGFGTLANGGVHCKPFVVAEIIDRHGRVIDRGGNRCEQVVDPGIAARATNLLEGPIRGGTASRNGQLGRPAAGKTGTAQGYKDAWFIGFVPQLSAGVWMGYERGDDPLVHPACPRGVTGGCVPTMVWRDFMLGAIEVLGFEPEGFPTPPPIPTDTVPNVLDMLIEEATEVMEEAGFHPRPETVTDYRPAGTVITQTPPGGASAPRGSAVELEVSDGTGLPPVMPNLTGKNQREATEIITGLNLELWLGVRRVPVDDPRLIDLVFGQTPAAGTDLVLGERVWVELGREPTAAERPTPTPAPTPSEPEEEPTTEPTPEPTSTTEAGDSG